MSHSHLTVASSSNFQLIINGALEAYKKRTRKDLLAHPLATELQSCDSPGAILAILHQQVQGLDQSRSDERWTNWLDPTINVLFAFSSTLGAGVGLVCLSTCAYLISAYVYLADVLTRECNLCRYRCSPLSTYPRQLGAVHYNTYISQAAKDVRASQDTLIDIFERIEMFFRRLEAYTDVPTTTEMMDTIILIMVEVLSILGVATKEIRRGRMSEY